MDLKRQLIITYCLTIDKAPSYRSTIESSKKNNKDFISKSYKKTESHKKGTF